MIRPRDNAVLPALRPLQSLRPDFGPQLINQKGLNMTSRYLQRLERLEAALRPTGRVFPLWDDYDGTTLRSSSGLSNEGQSVGPQLMSSNKCQI